MCSIDDVSAPKQVQQRLLDAAERLFCEKGFDGTSIRDITSEAKCNVAAVNYHFSGKDNLYQKVFQRHMRALREVRLAGIEKVMSENDVTLERLLRAFAMVFIEPLLDKSRGGPFMKLMIREMLDPRLPRKMFVEELAGPTLNALGKGIGSICPGLDQQKIVLSVISVVGQLIQVIRLKEMFDMGDLTEVPEPSLTEMVEHIVKFSVAGIQAAANGKNH